MKPFWEELSDIHTNVSIVTNVFRRGRAGGDEKQRRQSK